MPDAIFTEQERREWVEQQMLKDGLIPPKRECTCERCQMARHFTVAVLPVCPNCGSKRCAKAHDHREECTGE